MSAMQKSFGLPHRQCRNLHVVTTRSVSPPSARSFKKQFCERSDKTRKSFFIIPVDREVRLGWSSRRRDGSRAERIWLVGARSRAFWICAVRSKSWLARARCAWNVVVRGTTRLGGERATCHRDHGSRGVPGHSQSGHQAENVPVFRHSALRAVRSTRQGGSRTRWAAPTPRSGSCF